MERTAASTPDGKDLSRSSASEQDTMQERELRAREINESGHVQELERNFSLLSICSVGIVTGNTWAALGGSMAIAFFNGGPPGVIFEFIAVSIFYWLVAASLAELASSMPSSAGVYHWASVTPGPRYGRICGWFAGWWNFFAWNFACASMASITSNICIGMYSVSHPEYVWERWHTFIGYLIATWMCCGIVLFANRALPMINNFGLFFIIAGVVITIVVCTVMPSITGSGHASSSFVWSQWNNQTGYTSDGFVFLAGMLNGAFAIGTPDCVSHLAEEIPKPKYNLPLAIAAQMVIGFFMAFFYMIAIFYAISSLDAIDPNNPFPLAQIYAQATSSEAGTIGLLLVILLPITITLVGSYITAGRTLWTLARDGATPFPLFTGRISPRFKNPFNATLICGINATILGGIYTVSLTAFNAFVGSFIVLSTLSYLTAILPFVLNRRFHGRKEQGHSVLIPGPYRMGPALGYAVNILSCLYIMVFIVIYCFPYSLPVAADKMNYSSLIVGGLTMFIACWWVWTGKGYIGPEPMVHDSIEHNALDMGTIPRK